MTSSTCLKRGQSERSAQDTNKIYGAVGVPKLTSLETRDCECGRRLLVHVAPRQEKSNGKSLSKKKSSRSSNAANQKRSSRRGKSSRRGHSNRSGKTKQQKSERSEHSQSESSIGEELVEKRWSEIKREFEGKHKSANLALKKEDKRDVKRGLSKNEFKPEQRVPFGQANLYSKSRQETRPQTPSRSQSEASLSQKRQGRSRTQRSVTKCPVLRSANCSQSSTRSDSGRQVERKSSKVQKKKPSLPSSRSASRSQSEIRSSNAKVKKAVAVRSLSKKRVCNDCRRSAKPKEEKQVCSCCHKLKSKNEFEQQTGFLPQALTSLPMGVYNNLSGVANTAVERLRAFSRGSEVRKNSERESQRENIKCEGKCQGEEAQVPWFSSNNYSEVAAKKNKSKKKGRFSESESNSASRSESRSESLAKKKSVTRSSQAPRSRYFIQGLDD